MLAMLQSTGKSQVAFSHKRGTENASYALMEKMEKKKDAQKEPTDLQELCAFSAKVHQKCAKVGPKT